MAKKKTEKTAETEATTPAPEAKAEEKEKKTAPKAKGAKEKAPKKDAAADQKTAPEAPAAAPAAPEAEAKKKGKRRGFAPPLGKKLKKHTADLKARIAQQGSVALELAVAFLKKNKRVKFDETVEVHMSLGIDPKQSDQMVRGSVALPHGIGKAVRLLVFAKGENADKAKAAGADFVGAEDLAKKIQEGWLDFDAALATPDMMGVVGRLGKVLGPRGLMPTPKAGTVISGDVIAAVKEFKAGKVEFRADAGGNIHAPVGKLSFTEEKLVGNASTLIDAVRHAKPPAAKGHYIQSITVSATMSPGVPVLFSA